jgi:hypothetical protein
MSKSMRTVGVPAIFLVVFVITAFACGSPGTVTETLTEAEINEDPGLEGMVVDLQPGKIVFTGDAEGMSVELEMTMQASADGGVLIEVTNVLVDGSPMPVDMFEGMGAEISDTFYHPEEGYIVESVEITEDTITITSVKQ